METIPSKQFGEKIRIMERKLGLLEKYYTDSFIISSITLTQCHTLVEIGKAKSIALKDLSMRLNLDISTTSRNVDALVKKNYVQRVTSELDRRSVNIFLTDNGKELFCDIENKMDNFFEQIFSRIPEQDKANVLHSLELILDAFNKK